MGCDVGRGGMFRPVGAQRLLLGQASQQRVAMRSNNQQTIILTALLAISCAGAAIPGAEVVNAEVTAVRPPQVAPAPPSLLEVQLETGGYFTEGTLKQAKEAFDSGKFKLATKLLESEDSDRLEVR